MDWQFDKTKNLLHFFEKYFENQDKYIIFAAIN
jgi:hypothetical protein